MSSTGQYAYSSTSFYWVLTFILVTISLLISVSGSCSSIPDTHRSCFCHIHSFVKIHHHWLVALWPIRNYPLCDSSQSHAGHSTSSHEYCNFREGWLVLWRGNSPVRCPDLSCFSDFPEPSVNTCDVCDHIGFSQWLPQLLLLPSLPPGCHTWSQAASPGCSFPLHAVVPLLPCSVTDPSASSLGHSHLASPISPTAIGSPLNVLCVQQLPVSSFLSSSALFRGGMRGSLCQGYTARKRTAPCRFPLCAKKAPFGCFNIAFPTPLDGALGHSNSSLCCRNGQCSLGLQNRPLALRSVIIPEISSNLIHS